MYLISFYIANNLIDMLTGLNNAGYSSIRGYIYVPDDMDRDAYVKTALRTERVCVVAEDSGAFLKNVYIARDSIQDIYFPREKGQIGSCVACVNILPQNEYIVVAVVSKNDESQLLEEYEFRKEKRSLDGVVSISGKGKSGEMFINIDSKQIDGGRLFVNIKNSESKGQLKINVDGDSSVYSNGNIELQSTKSINLSVLNNDTKKESIISYKNGDGFSYKDEFDNEIITQSDGSIHIKPNGELKLGDGAEKILKGESTVTELNKCTVRIDSIINAINNAPVAAGDGGASFKSALIASLSALTKEDYSDVLSDKTFSE